jgi:hypothetical protein
LALEECGKEESDAISCTNAHDHQDQSLQIASRKYAVEEGQDRDFDQRQADKVEEFSQEEILKDTLVDGADYSSRRSLPPRHLLSARTATSKYHGQGHSV